MRTKRTAVLIFLMILLIIAAVAGGVVCVKNYYIRRTVEVELEKTVGYYRSEGVSTEELKGICETYISDGKWLPVEEAVKAYLYDMRVLRESMQKTISDDSLNNILEYYSLAENAPDFTSSREAVNNALTELSEQRDTYVKMTSSEGAISLYSYSFGSEYDEFFLKYTVGDEKENEEKIQENLDVIDDMLDYLDTCNKVFDHLTENKGEWSVRDNTIYFNDADDLEAYRELTEGIY